jgi:hypothetical protein
MSEENRRELTPIPRIDTEQYRFTADSACLSPGLPSVSVSDEWRSTPQGRVRVHELETASVRRLDGTTVEVRITRVRVYQRE